MDQVAEGERWCWQAKKRYPQLAEHAQRIQCGDAPVGAVGDFMHSFLSRKVPPSPPRKCSCRAACPVSMLRWRDPPSEPEHVFPHPVRRGQQQQQQQQQGFAGKGSS